MEFEAKRRGEVARRPGLPFSCCCGAASPRLSMPGAFTSCPNHSIPTTLPPNSKPLPRPLLQKWLLRATLRPLFVVVICVLGICLPFFNDIVGLVGAIGAWRPGRGGPGPGDGLDGSTSVMPGGCCWGPWPKPAARRRLVRSAPVEGGPHLPRLAPPPCQGTRPPSNPAPLPAGFWPATVYFPIECWIRIYKPDARKRIWLRVRWAGERGWGVVGGGEPQSHGGMRRLALSVWHSLRPPIPPTFPGTPPTPRQRRTRAPAPPPGSPRVPRVVCAGAERCKLHCDRGRPDWQRAAHRRRLQLLPALWLSVALFPQTVFFFHVPTSSTPTCQRRPDCSQLAPCGALAPSPSHAFLSVIAVVAGRCSAAFVLRPVRG